jgi:UDP-N-acetylglucosamine acyltransferase
MSGIHPTAIIGKNVKLGSNVTVSPYSILEGDIEIGDGCHIGPYVQIKGIVRMGKNNKVHSNATIGDDPQDLSWDGKPGLVVVGDNNSIREGVTIHSPIRGGEGGTTVLGNDCLLMVNSHLGHNVKLGNGVILANGCVLGGFVEVGDYAFLSGNVASHQNCRVGAYSMTGGLSKITQDIPPYTMVNDNPASFYGLNVVGLKRRGFNQEQRTRIKDAYNIIYGNKPRKEVLEELETKYGNDPIIREIIDFVGASKRGIAGFHEE